MARVVKFVGVAVVVVVVGLAALLGAMWAFLPTERLVALAQEQTRAATGRALRIDGALTPSLWPVLGVTVERVALANAPWGAAPALVSADRVAVALDAAALLGGRVEVQEIRVEGLDAALEVNPQGEANWLFDVGGPTDAEAASQASEPTGDAGAGAGVEIGRVLVLVEDGAVSFADAVSGARHAARAIALRAEMDALEAPLRIEGSAALDGTPAALTLTLDSAAALLDGTEAQVALAVEAAGARARYDGVFAAADTALAGRFALEAPDVDALAAVAGAGPIAAVGAAEAQGDVAFGADRVLRLSRLALSADDVALAGALNVDLSGPRPALSGVLNAGAVDLRPLLGGDAGGGAGGGAGGAPGGGWSDAPIDLSGLRAADVDLRLTAEQVRLDQAALTDVALAVALADGALALTIERLGVFGGGLRGVVGATAAGAVRADMALSGAQLQPALAAFAGADRLTGSAALTADLRAEGGSVARWMNSLAGTASMRLTDGAVLGFNLAAMVRNLGGAFDGGPAQKTDFAEISASATISQGVARNDDFAFLGPLLRADGAGTIDIGGRSLDYRLTPKAVASLQGQGGAADLTGLAVPVTVRGPWSGPSIQPDLQAAIQGLLTDPDGVARGLDALTQGAAPAGVGQAVQDALEAEDPEKAVRDQVDRVVDQVQKDPAGAVRELLGGGGLGGLLGR